MLDILIGKIQSSHGAQETMFVKCKLILKYFQKGMDYQTTLTLKQALQRSRVVQNRQ
jgi:hypothetical protein